MQEDKEVLVKSVNLLDAGSLQQLEETNQKLITQVKSEKVVVADLINELNFVRSEVTRLETVLTYYDERMTFLV